MFISLYVERFAPSRRGEAGCRRVEANANIFFSEVLPHPEKTQTLSGTAEQIETDSREYTFIEIVSPSKTGEATAIFFLRRFSLVRSKRKRYLAAREKLKPTRARNFQVYIYI